MKTNKYFKYAKMVVCILLSFSAYAHDELSLPTLGGEDVLSDKTEVKSPSTLGKKKRSRFRESVCTSSNE